MLFVHANYFFSHPNSNRNHVLHPPHSFVCTRPHPLPFRFRLPAPAPSHHHLLNVNRRRATIVQTIANTDIQSDKETCVLVGVDITTRSSLRGETRLFSVQDSLAELSSLAQTANLEVLSWITQSLPTPNASTFVGTGKVSEIKQELNSLNCCTVIIDAEIGPSQQRSLEEAFGGEREGIKVLDRTALILDIFAQKAATREALLQTELALYEYRKSRLTRMWLHLSRQAGGGSVACRGPGETQLEVDKRAIGARISRLRREIEAVRAHRQRQRKARQSHSGLPNVALVGYTNAGKSALLNAMTGADALAEDKLFATLDTKIRKASLDNKLSPEILVTDTVGFVQNLPTTLVAAFRATLEEVSSADVLAHVVDASVGAELAVARMEAVANVLREIDASDEKPMVLILNKVDLVEEEELAEVRSAVSQFLPDLDIVELSAISGDVSELCLLLGDVLSDLNVPVTVCVPFDEGGLVSAIYERGSVDFEEHQENGTFLEARVPLELAKRLTPYKVHDDVAEGNIEEYVDEDSDAFYARLARKRH